MEDNEELQSQIEWMAEDLANLKAELNSQVLFRYKDKNYYIENMCEMKCPVSREWKACFIYVAVEGGKRYCREQLDFNRRFKAV